MNKLINLFLILGLCSTTAHAQQSPNVQKLLQQLNESIQAKPEAYYEISFKHKSMLDNDTSAFKGRVYYSRSATKKEGCGKFLLYEEDLLTSFYDGVNLCNIGHIEREIYQYDTVSTLQSVIAGSLPRENMVFMPIVENRKKALDPVSYQHAKVLETNRFNIPCYVLEKTDSFPVGQDDKIYPTDPDMGAVITKVYIRKTDYSIAAVEQWIYLNSVPQYKAYEISVLYKNQDMLWGTVSDTVNYYQTLGYTLANRSSTDYTTDSEEIDLGKVAELFSDPEYILTNLNSDTVLLGDVKGEIILLDFWYRACLGCVNAIPMIKSLQEEFSGKGLKVLAINPIDRNVEKLQQYRFEKSINYEILLAPSTARLIKAGIRVYPTFVLYDNREKKVLFFKEGFDEEGYEQIKAILTERL